MSLKKTNIVFILLWNMVKMHKNWVN